MKHPWLIGSLAMLLVIIPNVVLAATPKTFTFEQYAKNFYDRYSKNFDQHGVVYSMPSYGAPTFVSPGYPRDAMLLATYYRFRARRGDVSALQAIQTQVAATTEYLRTVPSDQPFSFSQGMFLLIRYLDSFHSAYSAATKSDILTVIKSNMSAGLANNDGQNRGLTNAAHWQYNVNYLSGQGWLTAAEKKQADVAIKKIVDASIKDSISPAGWYREGKYTTLHYHAVSANNLLFYGQLSRQAGYVRLANKMYYNLKKLSYHNGLVESGFGYRPIGNGPQFYTMMGVLGTMAKDPDAAVYFTYASGSRFFSDPARRNRLEFHQTLEKKSAVYHDDIATSDVIEMAYTLPGFPLQKKITVKNKFTRPTGTTVDTDFRIINRGGTIAAYDKKRRLQYNGLLGSYGNFSHLLTKRY